MKLFATVKLFKQNVNEATRKNKVIFFKNLVFINFKIFFYLWQKNLKELSLI